MVEYVDKTNLNFKSLEVSFLGMEWADNRREVPKTTALTVKLLERPNLNIGQQTSYKENWKTIFPDVLVPTGVWNGVKLGQLTSNKIFVAIGTNICELNTLTGEVIWSKGYANTSIDFIKLTTKNDALYVLYSYYKFSGHNIESNLIKIDLTGKVIWSAKTKEKDDIFTSFSYEINGLSAFTWNCWRLNLDEDSGEITRANWTK